MLCSASMTIRLIIATASRGYLPLAVSPESMTASVPSKTAFATSLASARVGRGFSIMDSLQSKYITRDGSLSRRFYLTKVSLDPHS